LFVFLQTPNPPSPAKKCINALNTVPMPIAAPERYGFLAGFLGMLSLVLIGESTFLPVRFLPVNYASQHFEYWKKILLLN